MALSCSGKSNFISKSVYIDIKMSMHQFFRRARDRPITAIHGRCPTNGKAQYIISLKNAFGGETMSMMFHLRDVLAQTAVSSHIIFPVLSFAGRTLQVVLIGPLRAQRGTWRTGIFNSVLVYTKK